MCDCGMHEKAEMFEVCVKLKDAALGLDKIALGKELEEHESHSLEFTASLIAVLDREIEDESDFSICRATSIRPLYYRALSMIFLYPDVPEDFNNKFYQCIKQKKLLLPMPEMELGQSMLQSLSDNLLARYGCNVNI